MMLDLKTLIKEYKMDIQGIIHIGAHEGQEIALYEELGISNCVLFEPLPDVFKKLSKKCPAKYTCFNCALSDKDQYSKMYRENVNGGQSSSLLKPGLHTEYYPDIVFDSVEMVHTKTLDSFNFSDKYNLLNIDVQGAELLVLKGAKKTLNNNIDYVYLELNFEQLYEGCALANEIDDFLSIFGFNRVVTGEISNGWTDGLYIRK
jgi:FkbM family methyltransferase